MNTSLPKREKAVSAHMEAARDWLAKHRVPYEQKTPYHLKMGTVNFYPTTGKITIDGEPPYGPKGLNALLEVLIFARVID